MKKNKVWVSWSSGKDSAYALYKIQQEKQYEVTGLLCAITKNFNRVSMHSTRLALLEEQAKRVNLPLHLVFIPYPCTNEIYEAAMQSALEKAMNLNIKHIVFGDLFLENIRAYREKMLARTGIQPLFPLWKEDTHSLARTIISDNFKAILTCVDPKKLNPAFAGREFNESFLDELPPGIDPCAENGEFHTFVYDGPIFSSPISVSAGEIVRRDGFVFSDVLLKT